MDELHLIRTARHEDDLPHRNQLALARNFLTAAINAEKESRADTGQERQTIRRRLGLGRTRRR
ncbi:hypothetical protein [Streptomyces sp. NPDC059063]|uniref:hypothetical protein n=1 Tax=unclassified Streptomyces TaxID=2593676 RepID=UPI0036AADC0A